MLVEQLEAFLGLALAGEEQALDLGEAQHAVVGMDGFQNAPVARCKPHRRRIGDAPILGQP